MTEQTTAGGIVVPGYRREHEDVDPPHDYPDYKSTALRHPNKPFVLIPDMLTEVTGPLLGDSIVGDLDHDLTRQHPGEPIGQRIIVHGRVLDSDGRAIPNTLVEIWQANSTGRYAHVVDQHPSPLDPNFTGVGRCMTDNDGYYKFITIQPGAYPWGNHYNAWRPAHIHFSLFGRAFTQRLVTQMYFPGDPLFPFDPIFNSVADPKGREAMICRFDMDNTVEQWALAYEWDIVLRGRDAVIFQEPHDD